MHLLEQRKTVHHTVSVYDTNSLYGETGRFRILVFGEDAIQGAVDLRDPSRIVFEYPRAVVRLLSAGDPQPRSVFLIGHGIGTIASRLPEGVCTTAELDEAVVALSARYFGSDAGHVRIGDGRRLLADEPDGRRDFIVLDAFNAAGTPRHLTTLEFFLLARDKLQPRGSIIMNLIGRGGFDIRLASIHATLSEVFDYTRAFRLPGGSRTDVRNYLLVGRSRPIEPPAGGLAGFRETDLGTGPVLRDPDSGH